ncbi:MAG: hypothetical protein HQ507_04455 [Candidatus Marinimicrobia bacterium]|nr:hypothetical protein [Candidatus Neomarinimicrobiota bacterium]
MSRKVSLIAILMMALMVLFTVSCEGPAGPAGEMGLTGDAGAAGADAQVTCLSCHNDDSMEDNKIELARSQHGLGDLAVDYAGGRSSCAACHSHEGFVEFANTGGVAGNFFTPSAWECSTCHGLHKTFTETLQDSVDYALRLTNAVASIIDATIIMDIDPSSNLCINCHQSRTNIIGSMWDGSAATATITSTHAGPHHGPQANLLLGNNGSISTGTPFSPHLEAGCVGCHMYETSSDDEINVNGGHTFWPAAEKCNSCHTGPDVVFDASRSGDDFEHEGYYDYKSFQTEIGEKLEILAGLLLTEGVFDSSHTVIPATYTATQYKAFWNFTYIAEDRSHGVHNPYYTEALLDESIAALTP